MHFKDLLEKRNYINTNKEYFFILDGRVPISPSMWKKINKIKKVPLAYHITNPAGLKTVQKIEGSKKQISCFTNGDHMLSYGVETDGGILIELEGESTLEIDGDGWTSLDRSGYRWWDLKEMSNQSLPKLDKLQMKLREVARDILEDYFHTYFPNEKNLVDYGPAALTAMVEERFSGKDKANFIKRALDAFETNLNHINFQEIIDIADTKYKETYSSDSNYFNELVVHHVNIKNVYAVVPTGRMGLSSDMDDFLFMVSLGTRHIDGYVKQRDIAKLKSKKIKVYKTAEEI